MRAGSVLGLVLGCLLVLLRVSSGWKFAQQTYRGSSDICEFYTATNDQQGWMQRAYEYLRNDSRAFTPEAVAAMVSGVSRRIVSDPLSYLSLLPRFTPAGATFKFPQLVHMSLREKNMEKWDMVTMLSVSSWLLLNPRHVILLYDDYDMEQYVATFTTSHLDLFKSLEYGVQRSDLWRYMVMCGHGGVYADSDTLCVAPIDTWNANNQHDADILLGLESISLKHKGEEEVFDAKFTQWVLSATPGHEVFCNIPQKIASQTIKVRTSDFILQIVHTTGPAMFALHVRENIKKQVGHSVSLLEISEGGLYGNVRVLGLEAFGCPTKFFSGFFRQGILLFHAFRSSWHGAAKSPLSG